MKCTEHNIVCPSLKTYTFISVNCNTPPKTLPNIVERHPNRKHQQRNIHNSFSSLPHRGFNIYLWHGFCQFSTKLYPEFMFFTFTPHLVCMLYSQQPFYLHTIITVHDIFIYTNTIFASMCTIYHN